MHVVRHFATDAVGIGGGLHAALAGSCAASRAATAHTARPWLCDEDEHWGALHVAFAHVWGNVHQAFGSQMCIIRFVNGASTSALLPYFILKP
eukprot:scaffold16010_cov20-Tisochrysis_lutea.AAC.1